MASVLNVSGRINDKGGMLLPMELIRDFCRGNAGARIIVKITALAKDVTARQRGYYWGYVVPELRKGFAEKGTLMTDAETDDYIRSLCPICWREGENLTVAQLDCEEMTQFLDWLKQYAAENLSVFVEDPACV